MTAVLDFEPMAHAMVARELASSRLPAALERQDLEQSARLAILELEGRHDANQAPFSAYLATMLPWALKNAVRRAAADRRSKRVRVYSVDVDDLRHIPDASVSEQAWTARLDCQRILEQLSAEHRSVLWWHFAEGYSAPEIGRALGLTAPEVDALIKRALRAARAVVAGRLPLDDEADMVKLLEALQAGAGPRGKLPSRDWVCAATGLSELRYARLMRQLVVEGKIVGRGPRCSGWLAGEGGQAA